MAGRKAEIYDNKDIQEFLIDNDFSVGCDYADLPSWLDDIISGACGQIAGTQKFSPPRLWRLLYSLDTISTELVSSAINRKRLAFGDAPVSERYIRYVCAALRCASQAIRYHKRFRTINNTTTQNVSTDFNETLKFTEIELDMIRSAAKISSEQYKQCVLDIIELRKQFA